MKKRLSIPAALLLIVMIAGQFGLFAASVTAGSTQSVPNTKPPVAENGWVQVFTKEQLVYINQNQTLYLTEQIRLMNDIDISGYDWVPFGGNSFAPFSGIFDGQGHAITGVEIYDSSNELVGFFGEANGNIQNISLSVDIVGGNQTGGLAGTQSGGSIDRAYTEGSVISGSIKPTVSSAGGIAGALKNASLVRSSSSASVSVGSNYNMYAGGLVGFVSYGSINDSYSTGAISNEPSSYHLSTSGISAYQLFNTIKNTYATGNISTLNAGSSTLRAGIAAYAYQTNISSTFFDTTTTGMNEGIGYFYESTLEITGKTTPQMKQQATYIGWDFINTWIIHANVNNGYPYLRPAVLTSELPRAVQGSPYSFNLAGFDGAHAGLTWSAAGLPTGMIVSSSGELHGTPAQSGIYNVRLSLTDAGSATASRDIQLVVDLQAPDIEVYAIHPGQAVGSTKITAAPNQASHTFAYVLGSTSTSLPLVGDALPNDALEYVSGEDIPSVSTGQYLDLYEVDDQQLIQAWRRIELEDRHIQLFVPVSGIRLAPSTVTLSEGGESMTLTATIEPVAATNQNIIWSTSDAAVATVSQYGEVFPVAEGTAIITVTAENSSYTAAATITVIPPPAMTGTVTGSVYGAGNAPLNGATVSINSISTVTDSEGKFTLDNIPNGEHTIKVTAQGYETLDQIANVLAGQVVDLGAITLIAIVTATPDPTATPTPVPTPIPAVGSSQGATSAADLALLKLTLNNQEISVKTTLETAADGQPAIRLKPDAVPLVQAFASSEEVLIKFNDSRPVVFIDLPAEVLLNVLRKQPGAAIAIEVNGSGYQLPLHTLKNMKDSGIVTIAIGKASPDTVSSLSAAVAKQGFELIGSPVDFSLYMNGQLAEGFNEVYTERVLSLSSPVDPRKSTAVWVDANNKLHFVPAVFKTDGHAGSAVIYTPHNSLYAVISSDHSSFADLEGHWVQADIELLSNKLIVQGYSHSGFAPDQQVTRAEFAALLVRALGLADHKQAGSFSDVAQEAWYAGAIGIAQTAGLIEGFENGMFKPDAPITREQMASVIVRALNFAGQTPQSNAAALDTFSDRSAIADWALEPVAKLLEDNLIQGYPAAAFSPKEPTTRAQSAVIILRMLQYLKFINN
ncbi:S-layer homology domain-containing protein [Paenibacillus algorifonticola]|uniref:S-layer homology domain-containing protein n=1 Tax=Paenibacillus algorifonticola TaxID=684063 RepID=A0A1I2ACP2_9BACL|nr:S-layer homology domain-containing protein [Paenibacillus algorifonticola]SFE40753.1 S-layer homology domain-containing protein [Paenibacillus algorifonticola]